MSRLAAVALSRRPLVVATSLGVLACSLSACSDADHKTTTAASAPNSASVAAPARPSPRLHEVLSLAALGTFQGRCSRGARVWTFRFIARAEATDAVRYRIGGGQRRTVELNPGQALTFHLAPNAARTREPPDRMIPPAGQGRGLTGATAVPTTAPLRVQIYQGTEPQTLRADIRLALTAIGGETGQCVLVGSTVTADTYPNQSNSPRSDRAL